MLNRFKHAEVKKRTGINQILAAATTILKDNKSGIMPQDKQLFCNWEKERERECESCERRER